jgi:hypothetical protein
LAKGTLNRGLRHGLGGGRRALAAEHDHFF